MARRGARPVAVDPTPTQLAIARRMQADHDLRFPLVRAVGEQVPLRSGRFDVAISEYGAAIWADPYRWIPEAARLLRPGGELIFLGNSTLMMLCVPDEDGIAATDQLVRPQRRMCRFEWLDDESVEFHLSPGDWIRVLRDSGFAVEDLVELYAPDAAETSDYPFVTPDWARRWPHEEVWRARRLG
jgi:SAM-dependent methyltransferase